MSRLGREYFAIIAEGYVPANTGGVIDLSPKYSARATELDGGILIAPAAGTPGFLTITLAGTYAVGDRVIITITSNITGKQLFRRSYEHIVQSGATSVTAIAAALAAKITGSITVDGPIATATSAAGVITVTQSGDDMHGLVGYVDTDSAAGTIANVPTATVLSEGQPSDLVDKGIDPSEINLASYDTVRISLRAEASIPFIDSVGATAKEIYWFGTVGNGVGLVAIL